MVQQIIMSMLLGMIPEVLFFSLLLVYTKGLNEKQKRLFILLCIIYICCFFIKRYQLIYYILFIALVYGVLLLLYKEKIQLIDIFVIAVGEVYLSLISYVPYVFFKEDLSNYYILLLLNRVLLFVPFIFRNKFNYIYKKYCSLWNRNDSKKRIIKSITLRNISLITINLAIFFMNIYITSILNFIV